MSPAAEHAVRAARHERIWGPRAARAYARRMGCFRLFLLARLLERS